MVKFNPKFNCSLKLLQIRIFKHALNHTLAIDIYKVLLNKGQSLYHNCEMCILVFDITSPETFIVWNHGILNF